MKIFPLFAILFLNAVFGGAAASKSKGKGAKRLMKSYHKSAFDEEIIADQIFRNSDLAFDFRGSMSLSLSFSFSMPVRSFPDGEENEQFVPTQSPPQDHNRPESMPEADPKPASSSYPTSTFGPSFTASPNFISREAPTDVESCQSVDGSFGTIDGEQVTVEFAYELETTPVVGSIETVVIPNLEFAFTDFLLPVLFQDRCSTVSQDVQDLQDQVIGISARPDDVILSSLTCSSLLDETHICAVVQGELTLFIGSAGGRRLVEAGSIIHDSLKEGMDDGYFNSVHNSIERVTIVDTNDNNDEEILDRSRGFGGLMIGLVAAGAGGLLIAIGALAYRRKQQKKGAVPVFDQSATLLSDPANETIGEEDQYPIGVCPSMDSMMGGGSSPTTHGLDPVDSM